MPYHGRVKDAVFIGRIRHLPSCPYRLDLFVVAVPLRKGAATNALQIAQKCMALGENY